MKQKKLLSLLIICALIITMFIPAASYGATFADTQGHWAESYIDRAVGYGFVQGYPDGTFMPDKSVTRAEFTTMINKALKNTATANISFSDVPYSEWFYQDVSKALAATYVAGYEDNTFKPNNPITRQEAAVIISRIIPTYGSYGDLNAFSDRSSIADWAYTAFQKVNGKAYMGAYDDGNLHPLDQLTRAQTAKIICDILDNERLVTQDPSVSSNNTTLSNTIYSNGVTIQKDLGDGNATIDNCVILGNLAVQGGGDGTVTVSNSRVAQSTVEKSTDSVRLLVKGETVISTLTAAKTATIQTSNLAGGLYGSGINNLFTLSSSDISLLGNFPKVTVNGASASLGIASGSVSSLTIGSNASKSEITVDSSGSVGTVDVNAESYFKGNGTITKMNVGANGITYEKKPSNVTMTDPRYGDPQPVSTEADITFKPANGTGSVKVDASITITFKNATTLYNGKEITGDNIEDFVALREKTSSGTKATFTATINKAKTIITITPDYDLTDNQRYYIVIPRNSVKDNDGNGNAAQSVWFSTGTGGGILSFSPKDGDTGIAVNTTPMLTFSEAVQTYDGKVLTNSFFDNTVIIFRENSSSGARVSFTASYNSSRRELTITPVDNKNNRIDLKENQKYYLGLANNKIQTSADSVAVSDYVTWTTAAPASAASDFNLSAVTAPVSGATPVRTIDKTQYSGSVTWTPTIAASAAFAPGTTYTATVSLTAKSGYTFTGVGANRFTCTGSTSVSNPANGSSSGTIMTVTISFPATGAATVPGAPQNLSLNPGDTQIGVSWTAPANSGGSTLTGYKIQLDNGTVITKTPSQLTHTFNGLTNGTAYTVKVWAVNAVGDSAPAERVATTTTPAPPVFVAVEQITGIPASTNVGSLNLSGNVFPSTATNKTIVWSIANDGGTGANLSGNTLTTAAAGTVTVRATITNGATDGNYVEDFDITVNELIPN